MNPDNRFAIAFIGFLFGILCTLIVVASMLWEVDAYGLSETSRLAAICEYKHGIMIQVNNKNRCLLNGAVIGKF